MFEKLGDKLSSLISNFTGKVLKERDIDSFIGAIRNDLLDADTHPNAVELLTEELKKDAVGTQIHKALNVQQQLTKLIHKSLANILGEQVDFSAVHSAKRIMLVGLQGAGKTTTVAKIARYLKLRGKNPLVSTSDFSRPAAREQLETLCASEGISFYAPDTTKVSKLVKTMEQRAKINQNAPLILDTSGRSNIDKSLMKDLKEIDKVFKPDIVLLVLDSMVGRQVVDIAREFNDTVPLSGFIMSKLDSDTKGGAILSAYYSIKKPVFFVGTGEKLSDLDEFYPDRIASRILDLGDILSVAEKLEKEFDEDEQRRLEEKLKKNQFDIDDFFMQLRQVKRLGSVGSMLSMLPGGRKLANMASGVDLDSELDKIEAIINSMTKDEKLRPEIVDMSRRRRIARGSGTNITDVNKFLKNFDRMKKMMKTLNGKNFAGIGNILGRIK